MVGYWLKCQLEINLFPHISISRRFPFNYLNNDVITKDQPGIIFQADFNHFKLFSHWSDKTLLENYQGTYKKRIKGGIGQDSQCLMITCNSENYWSYPFRKYIAVHKGDRYHFEGEMYLEDETSPGGFFIAAFDAHKNVIDWGLAKKRTHKTGSWIKVEKNFSIKGERIHFLTFRLGGGKGTYRFDNLLLKKIK